MSSANRPAATRPLSPHLQVYRWQITMALSIAHRATGIALLAGAVYLVIWLAMAAGGPRSFAAIQWFNGSLLGQLFLLGWTACLYYHLANGIRHLVWDAGYGFEIPNFYKTGKAVLAFTAVMTLLTWILGYVFWS